MMNTNGRLFRILAWVVMVPLAVCLLGALLLEALGLRIGPTSAYGQNLSIGNEPVPTLLPGSSQPLPGTTITIWFLRGPRFFSADTIFARQLTRGTTADGKLAYYIEFDEAGFNQYMHYWFLPPGDELKQYVDGLENPRIDLSPGGLTLLADVQVGGQWKTAGLVYQLDASQRQLNFRGIEFEGSLISTVPDSVLDERVGSALERLANRALRELTFIDSTGAHLTISQITLDDDQAVVLATEAQ